MVFTMFQYLEHINPASIWLKEKFQISLRLASGRLVVVRFHLNECTPDGFLWDEDKIIAHFDPTFLVDTKDIYYPSQTPMGQYISTPSVIAHRLNDKMLSRTDEILSQVRMSFSILDALSTDNMAFAYILTGELGRRLLPYDPRASAVWSLWVDSVFKYIRSDNAPGYGLDTVI